MGKLVVAMFNDDITTGQAIQDLVDHGLDRRDIVHFQPSPTASERGRLERLGVPTERASVYAEGVRKGAHVLVVRSSETEVDRVRRVLDGYRPVDLTDRRQHDRHAVGGFEETRHPEQTTQGTPHEGEWRRHFGDHLTHQWDLTYDVVRPAYVLGWELAQEPRHRNAEWMTVEPAARARWHHAVDTPRWDQIWTAVRYAYETARDAHRPYADLS